MIDLALIDLTPNSRTVIRWAHWWSSHTGSALHLLHDVQTRLPALTDQETRDAWLEKESSKARISAQMMADEAVESPTSFRLHISRNELLGHIEQLHKDLVFNVLFVGAKSTGFLDKVLVGSHIIQLTEHFDIPIIAIPVGHEYRGRVHLHVAVSHQHDLNPATFLEFFRNNEAMIQSVEFFSVDIEDHDEERNRVLLTRLATETQLPVPISSRSYRGKDTLSVIKENLSRDPSKMLLVKKGSRAWTDRVFRKFLIHDLVYDGSIPLIILS